MPQVVESLLAWARAHSEIIERAQVYSRSHSGGEGTGAGTADLGEVSADPEESLCPEDDKPGKDDVGVS
jgi:hypothetical protein